jgi:BASS family bile acid:Na+ symporter
MLKRISNELVRFFPLLSLVVGGVSLLQPGAFLWFGKDTIAFGLGMIMLGMGMTLKAEDFSRVLRRPRTLLIGVGAQFLVMPACGFTIASMFGLPEEMALGLIMVSSCPGGTASNVIVYLARGEVALSVSMTMISTLLAVFLTPALVYFLAGQFVPVNPWSLFQSVLWIVLCPLTVGFFWNRYFPYSASQVSSFSPIFSVLFILLIVGFVLSAKKALILEYWMVLAGSVFLLHTVGFLLGYFIPRFFRCKEVESRAVSIEVGMQNSGLGMALTSKHFSHLPVAPAPCALSAVFHCIMGSALAYFWGVQKKI